MWLKYEICYAEGYDFPEYEEVGASTEEIEDMKTTIRMEHSDGLREPRWEVLEELSLDVLQAKVRNAMLRVAAANGNLAYYQRKLREQEERRDTLSLHVCEIYRSFGTAYACDDAGRRFLLNECTEGVDMDRLEVGQVILAHATERNYVDRFTIG